MGRWARRRAAVVAGMRVVGQGGVGADERRADGGGV